MQALVPCGYCAALVGESRFRVAGQRVCRACGQLTRMSRARRIELLRLQLSGELLRRVVLHPDDAVREDLQHAARFHTSGAFAARVAEIPTDVLTFAALRLGSHAETIAREIGRRGAGFALAERAGMYGNGEWRDAQWRMARAALMYDDTLTAAQIARLADSRFAGAVIPWAGVLDDATAARLVSLLGPEDAGELAALKVAPAAVLPALARKGPVAGWRVAGDRRTTAGTLAEVAGHWEDRAWRQAVNTALCHRNADLALMPVPALLSLGVTRRRALEAAEVRFGAESPARITTLLEIGATFLGTFGQLLDVAETVHDAAATNPG